MARIEKTVFISYRRKDVSWALAVYQYLTSQKYNVFFDYTNIAAGDFEQIIISNIKARAHFVLILTPTALNRCSESGDWLRREIETAIDEKRNIVPLFFEGFSFGPSSVSEKLTGKLKNLSHYNGMNIHDDFFQEAMERLRTRYLNIPLDTVLHPIPTEVQKVVKEEQVAADKELQRIEDAKELEILKLRAIQYELRGDFWSALQTYYKIRKIEPAFLGLDKKIEELKRKLLTQVIKIASALMLFAVFILGGVSIWNKQISLTPESTQTFNPTATQTSHPTSTLSPTVTSTITDTPTPSHTPTITPTSSNTPTPTPFPILSISTGGCGKFAFGEYCSVSVGISWIPIDKTNKVCVYVKAFTGKVYYQTDISYFPNRIGYTVRANIGDNKTPRGSSFTIYAVESAVCTGALNGYQSASLTIKR